MGFTSADNDRVTQADPKSVLGLNTATNSLTIVLRAEGQRLIGEDERFSYGFDQVEAGNADQPSPSLRPAGTLKADMLKSNVPQPSESVGRAGAPSPAVPDAAPSESQHVSVLVAPKLEPSDGGSAFPNLPVLPSGPMHAGAFVLVASGWVPLPAVHNYVVRSSARGLAGIVSQVQRVQDAMAGKSAENSAPIYGNLTFDGRDSLPVIPGDHVVIAYIGPLKPLTDEQQTRNPELRDYPVMELAPLKLDPRGNRYTPLYEIAPRRHRLRRVPYPRNDRTNRHHGRDPPVHWRAFLRRLRAIVRPEVL